MPRNMNNSDRAPPHVPRRPGAGSIVGIVLFALAAIMLATSAIGFCPLYKLLHLDTRGRTPLPH
jgi:hypothetical protein